MTRLLTRKKVLNLYTEISKKFNTASTVRYFTDGSNPVTVHNGLQSGKPLMGYARGWAWSHAFLNRRLRYISDPPITGEETADAMESIEDLILLLEHSPVYTLGRGASEKNLTFLEGMDPGGSVMTNERVREILHRRSRGPDSARLSVDRSRDVAVDYENGGTWLDVVDMLDRPSPVQAPNGVPIYRTDRGGEVTYHGPGQLVVYPILDLRRQPYQKDLHWYLRCMEEVIIRTLAVYDIVGVRDEINTGVWVGDEKIAAVGVSSSRWITTHGFSLNVNPDMSFFDTSFIIPCGIEERGVTSIFKIFQEQGKLASSVPSLQQISEVVLMCFNDTFGVFTKGGRTLS